MRKYRSVRPDLIPFVDYHTNILLVFVILLIFSSVKKSDESVQLSEIYQVVMTWEPSSATDMDLWAQDPMGNVVGFNRKEGGQGSLFCLKRDDLGEKSDLKADGTAVPINEEIISLRATKQGEYIVNGHCYLKSEKEKELKVKAKLVRIKPFKEIISTERTFSASGDEETFFRFKLDGNGEIVETNELPGRVATLVAEEDLDAATAPNPLGRPTIPYPTPPGQIR